MLYHQRDSEQPELGSSRGPGKCSFAAEKYGGRNDERFQQFDIVRSSNVA